MCGFAPGIDLFVDALGWMWRYGTIIAHNHPSGVAEPSAADGAITRRIVDAAALIDVRVLDHLVVGEREAVSMAALGML